MMKIWLILIFFVIICNKSAYSSKKIQYFFCPINLKNKGSSASLWNLVYMFFKISFLLSS